MPSFSLGQTAAPNSEAETTVEQETPGVEADVDADAAADSETEPREEDLPEEDRQILEDLRTCETIRSVLQEYTEIDDLNYCMNLYFSHGQEKSGVDTFRKARDFALRSIAVSEGRIAETGRRIDNTDAYVMATTVFYSFWVEATKNGKDIPEGKDGLDQALRLWKDGRKYNAKNPNYYYQAGQFAEPIARFYKPELYSFALESLELADAASWNPVQEAFIRVSIAQIHERLGHITRARGWFRMALKSDPKNVPAANGFKRTQKKLPEFGKR